MENGILLVTDFFKEILSLFTGKFDEILAFFLFFMGYRLFKESIKRININSGNLNYKTYLMLSLPAVFISLFGAVFVINLFQINLLIMFLFGALMTGIAFAIIGYKLLIKGIFPESDLNVEWEDMSLVLKRTTPGMLFGLFGVFVIVFSLLKGTVMVNNYQTTQATINKEVISAIDRNVPEITNVLKQYLNSQTNSEAKRSVQEL
ncbi:MAG: hypothetical protein ACYSTS_18055 [Planctomycetota bacterium]|jgi:hypothetical protein